MEFNEVVKQIEESEKNVDKVLKAGRLERCEKQPMSKERLEMILGYIAGYLGMVLMFLFFFTLFYLCR